MTREIPDDFGELVQCPVENCRLRVPQSQLERGVCPNCARRFKQEHKKILDPAYDAWKEPESKSNSAEVKQQAAHFDYESRRVQTTDDDESSLAFYLRMSKEHGVNLATIMLIVGEVVDRRSESASGADYDLVNQTYKNLFNIIRGDGLDVRALYDRFFYAMQAMGWDVGMMADGETPIRTTADLAKMLKVTRANATKYETMFRDVFPPGCSGMPARPGQRTVEHRLKFEKKITNRLAAKSKPH